MTNNKIVTFHILLALQFVLVAAGRVILYDHYLVIYYYLFDTT